MSFDKTKQRIRHRRYAELRRRGEPIPPDLASHFIDCPACKGRGTIGFAIIEEHRHVEVDDVCPKCHGEGFVPLSSS
jgi:DnaJ-class molecular chaperone